MIGEALDGNAAALKLVSYKFEQLWLIAAMFTYFAFPIIFLSLLTKRFLSGEHNVYKKWV